MRLLAFLLILFPLGLSAQELTGVIDIHAHSDPDSRARAIDSIDLARLAKKQGMRGLILKNHSEPTTSNAFFVRKLVPGLEVFGGIALNLTVGGVNPAAVEQMTRVKGGWGRVVWMPTVDAENQVRYSKQNRPFAPVVRGGRLTPEVHEVLALIAKHKLTLQTGHSAPEESLMIVRAARQLGIDRIVVSHPMIASVNMTVTQMQEAAKLGAYLEFVYVEVGGANKSHTIAEYTAVIRAVGTEHCILSSDLGQRENMLLPDGFAAFIRELRGQGFTQAELDRMASTNPATVLGLPE